MTLIESVHLLNTQNVPTEWLEYLCLIAATTAVIRWFTEFGLFFNYEALMFGLIESVIQGIRIKINIIQTFIDNGFVHTSIPLDITKTYAYLTEYIRSINRLIRVFGLFINLIEELGWNEALVENLYLDLVGALDGLTRLYDQLGDQLDLVLIQI